MEGFKLSEQEVLQVVFRLLVLVNTTSYSQEPQSELLLDTVVKLLIVGFTQQVITLRQ